VWDLDGMVSGWPWPGERCWILERGEVVVVPQIRTSYSAVLSQDHPIYKDVQPPKSWLAITARPIRYYPIQPLLRTTPKTWPA